MPEMTIVLRGDTAKRLQRLIDEEHYTDPEQVVADALEALEESRDPALDAWLRGVIVARAEALAADPGRAVPAAAVRARVLGES